jgi:hypothetical protein
MGFLAHLPDAIARVGQLVEEVHRESRAPLASGAG